MKSFFKNWVIAILKCEARFALMRHRPRIIAVTGTVGKTSAKDAIFCALQPFFSVRKSEKSFNSDFGIPLTILGLRTGAANPLLWLTNILKGAFRAFFPDRRLEWLVLEVGAGEPGDIKKFAPMLSPDIAVITQFADVPVHVEYFASPEAVVAEKTELVRAVREGGTLVLNADNEKVRALQTTFPNRTVVLFGMGETAEVRGSSYKVVYGNSGGGVGLFPSGMRFAVTVGGQSFSVEILEILGEHLIMPILAAFAVASALKLELSRVAETFKSFVPPDGRMRLISGRRNSLIIDDSYNASPVAVASALRTVSSLKGMGRKVVILGTMAELGSFGEEEHRKVGFLAGKSADQLLVVGEFATVIEKGAIEAGMNAGQIRVFETSEQAGATLLPELRAGDIVLVKGSQSARMERVVKAIMREPERAKELLVRQDDEWLDR